MKGNDQIISTLNSLLADELTAINQYMVHAAMCENWGYEKLHDAIEKRALEEMKHAESLIDRILFLEGLPVVSKLHKMIIGADVKTQFEHDLDAEYAASRAYNVSIRQSSDLSDNGTRQLLESILKDEEVHIDWLEAQLDQIKQISLENYLVEQIG